MQALLLCACSAAAAIRALRRWRRARLGRLAERRPGGGAQVPHGAAGYYLLGRICRLTNRQRQAVQHFAAALALDGLLWCAYEELCILGAPPPRAAPRLQCGQAHVRARAAGGLAPREVARTLRQDAAALPPVQTKGRFRIGVRSVGVQACWRGCMCTPGFAWACLVSHGPRQAVACPVGSSMQTG
jgi:hypothetical protein